MSSQESRDRYKKAVARNEEACLENEKQLIEAKMRYNKRKQLLAKDLKIIKKYHIDNMKRNDYKS